MAYFVWTKGLKDPWPEKWLGDFVVIGLGLYQQRPVGHHNSRLLRAEKLSRDEEDLSLSELVRKFPCPAQTNT